MTGRSPSPDPRVDIIANVLMWNLDIDIDGGPWVMDEDSPRSMAEKIVAALDGETTPARGQTEVGDEEG